MSELQVMDPTGHLNINWDADKHEEVRSARDLFIEKLAAGWSAFRVAKGGERGERIREFDPSAEQIMLIPQLVGG